MTLETDRRQFVATMRWAALGAGAKPWQADWFTAIAAHESGWGRAIPAGSKNYIGYEVPDAYASRWPHVEARESMSGRIKRYRKFDSLEDSARKWLYLVRKSGHEHYREARAIGDETQAQREQTILTFSRGYCPADPEHGPGVLDIFLRVQGGRYNA